MFVCSECGWPQAGDGPCPVDGTPLVPIGEDVLLGTMIGVYRVARLLGIGGMGRVYKGVHPTIGSRVAVKVLSRECTDRRDLVDRFFAEAKAVNLIRHESIVNVLDLAMLPDGRPYIIMEYLDGAPLQAIVEHSQAHGQPLPLGGLARLTVEVLDALHAAHAKNIVHRDLKPDNIFVAPSGRPKVLDFGIAKLTEPGSGGGATRTGSLLGTPHYMSPEQAAGRPVDHRADIYAIGVILFETMTGRKPFVADSLFELLRQHVEQPPPSPRQYRGDIDAGLEGVILTALAKLPEQRFATAQAMSMALQHATAHLPTEQWTPITGSGTHRAQPTGWQHTPPQSWGSRAQPMRQVVDAANAPRGVPRPSEQPLDKYLANAGLQHQTTVSASSGQVQKQPAEKKSKRGLWIALAAIAILIGVGVTIAVVSNNEHQQVAAADQPAPPPDKPADPKTPSDPPKPEPVKIETPDPGGPAPKPAPKKSKPAKTDDDDDDDFDKQVQDAVKDLPVDVKKQVDDSLKQLDDATKGKKPANQPKPQVWVQDRALQMAGWDPTKVDVSAFVRFAVAEAKKAVPDAQLTRIDVTGVSPDGYANLSLATLASSHGDIDIRFISPAASKPGPDEVQGVPVKRLCEFRVMGSPEGIEITPMFKTDCKERVVPVPSCKMTALWTLAKSQGAPGGKVVANIDYYQASMHDSPKWFFDIGFGHDVSFSKMWSGASCP